MRLGFSGKMLFHGLVLCLSALAVVLHLAFLFYTPSAHKARWHMVLAQKAMAGAVQSPPLSVTRQKNLETAEAHVLGALSYKPFDPAVWRLTQTLYQAQGDRARADKASALGSAVGLPRTEREERE